jgi:hypothetical protein
MNSYMEVLLVMPPGLEMWFGEVDLTDWEWEDDEDWPEEGWSSLRFSTVVSRVGFFSRISLSRFFSQQMNG